MSHKFKANGDPEQLCLAQEVQFPSQFQTYYFDFRPLQWGLSTKLQFYPSVRKW